MKDIPEWRAWKGMIDRCRPSFVNHKYYFDKGVFVCEQWSGVDGFDNFYRDMGKKPSAKMTIERLDNSKGYSPNNCIWADMKTQGNNTSRNKRLEYKGDVKTYAQWAEYVGCSRHTIRSRVLSGWSVHKILTTPPNHGNKWLND